MTPCRSFFCFTKWKIIVYELENMWYNKNNTEKTQKRSMSMNMRIEDLITATQLVKDVTKKAKKLDDAAFSAVIAMLMEERCKATGEDVRKFAETIFMSVLAINAEMGKY